MRPKILLLEPIHDKAREILEEVAELDYSKQLKEYTDIVWTGLTPILTSCVVACPCTGVDHIIAQKIIHLDEEWKRTEGQYITSTAEHTISLMLQLCKLKPMQLYGKRLGIIGYGRLGTMVDRLLFGFSLMVKECNGSEGGWSLNQLIPQCDIITLHVPLNEETKGMIGKEQFELMKDGALLINTSRPDVVDEKALVEALTSGKLGGYADDFENDRYLGNIYNVIQTPHIAGNALEAREATDIYVATKVAEFIKGGGLCNTN